jgi:hypothetical protein
VLDVKAGVGDVARRPFVSHRVTASGVEALA